MNNKNSIGAKIMSFGIMLAKCIINYDIKSPDETIKQLLSGGRSFARYGDGEFSIMFKHRGSGDFQDITESISSRLWEVWNNNKYDDLMIGIPYTMNNYLEYDEKLTNLNKRFWLGITLRYIIDFKFKLSGRYVDSLVFRTNCCAKDKTQLLNHYNLIKQLWDKKKVCIIEGENTKLGCSSDLMDNVSRIDRVIIPNKNAFQKVYEEVLLWAKENTKNYDLLLIIAGPMATILVYDLYKCGINSIDLGQIEKEYLLATNNSNDAIDDCIYKQQIIKTILG